MAVAVINDELALTAKSNLRFKRQVKEGERVVAKAVVKGKDNRGHTIVEVNSFVNNEPVLTGEFFMFHSSESKGE